MGDLSHVCWGFFSFRVVSGFNYLDSSRARRGDNSMAINVIIEPTKTVVRKANGKEMKKAKGSMKKGSNK